MSIWTEAAVKLTSASLQAIVAGEKAAIRVTAFASPRECSQLCAAAQSAAVEQRDASTSPMQLIGANFSNHQGATKADYFALARSAASDLKQITQASFDPVARVIAALSAAWPQQVALAREDDEYGNYFAGCIKTRTANSNVHFDYVPLIAPEYSIGNIREQLAWNVYLAMPQNSGETTLYHKPVPHHRAPSTVPDKLNFIEPDYVENIESYSFKPNVGELAIFNSRFPHKISVDVDHTREQRVQIGGFAGVMPDGQIVLWS